MESQEKSKSKPVKRLYTDKEVKEYAYKYIDGELVKVEHKTVFGLLIPINSL